MEDVKYIPRVKPVSRQPLESSVLALRPDPPPTWVAHAPSGKLQEEYRGHPERRGRTSGRRQQRYYLYTTPRQNPTEVHKKR